MENIKIFGDDKLLSRAAAHLFIDEAKKAIQSQGSFLVALAGGSTPQKTYTLLASDELAPMVEWSKVHIFWGDERCVPPDEEGSNYYMARESLLRHVPIPEVNIHRIEGERQPREAALRYQEVLRGFWGSQPHFDLVLLGMGADGHTASLFPGTSALKKTKAQVVANYVGKLASWRITLTAATINRADVVLFLISGNSKALTLKYVIHGKYRPKKYPAQLIKPSHGKLWWYLDADAAALLDLKQDS